MDPAVPPSNLRRCRRTNRMLDRQREDGQWRGSPRGLVFARPGLVIETTLNGQMVLQQMAGTYSRKSFMVLIGTFSNQFRRQPVVRAHTQSPRMPAADSCNTRMTTFALLQSIKETQHSLYSGLASKPFLPLCCYSSVP